MRRTRAKGAAVILSWILLAAVLSGCWDYRGLDELALVAGMAIDINDETGLFQMGFEVIDLTMPVEQEGPETFILQSEGQTIFEAIRNAKKEMNNRLYFADTNLVIVCRKIVEKYGILPVAEWFLRDNETRENAYIAVAQTGKANDMLRHKLREHSIISYEINEIIREDDQVTSSTVKSEMYEVYNILKEEGISLTIPALTLQEKNDQKTVPAVNGVIVFKGNKIVGALKPEETKFFLFATDRVKGGLFSFSSTEKGEKDVTLEIADNKTESSFEYADGRITVRIGTETEVYVAEVMKEADLVDQKVYEQLKAIAEESLKKEITKLIKKVQSEFKSDIFGFGRMIHKKDHSLWDEIGGSWEQMFPEVEVEVSCKMEFVNSAHLKNTGKE